MREDIPASVILTCSVVPKGLLNRFEIKSFQIGFAAFVANYFSVVEVFQKKKGCFFLGTCLRLDWDLFDLNLDI